MPDGTMKKDQQETISFRPETPELRDFIDEQCKIETRSRNNWINIQLRRVMEKAKAAE